MFFAIVIDVVGLGFVEVFSSESDGGMGMSVRH